MTLCRDIAKSSVISKSVGHPLTDLCLISTILDSLCECVGVITRFANPSEIKKIVILLIQCPVTMHNLHGRIFFSVSESYISLFLLCLMHSSSKWIIIGALYKYMTVAKQNLIYVQNSVIWVNVPRPLRSLLLKSSVVCHKCSLPPSSSLRDLFSSTSVLFW